MTHQTLSKSPITYFLAKINFSNIEAIEKYIPELQENIRRLFPDFKKVSVQFIDIKMNQQPSLSTRTQWHFINKESTTGVLLDNSSVAIHTSQYTQFEQILGELKYVLEEFNKILRISLLTRIGLRYINLIQGDLNRYVNPGLLGFYLKDNEYFHCNKFIINTTLNEETKYGIIKIQSGLVSNKEIINKTNNIFIPSDLMEVANYLSFNHHKQPEEDFLVLDLDHFSNNKEDFQINTIIDQLKNLQEALYRAFCTAVKPKALEDWR